MGSCKSVIVQVQQKDPIKRRIPVLRKTGNLTEEELTNSHSLTISQLQSFNINGEKKEADSRRRTVSIGSNSQPDSQNCLSGISSPQKQPSDKGTKPQERSLKKTEYSIHFNDIEYKVPELLEIDHSSIHKRRVVASRFALSGRRDSSQFKSLQRLPPKLQGNQSIGMNGNPIQASNVSTQTIS